MDKDKLEQLKEKIKSNAKVLLIALVPCLYLGGLLGQVFYHMLTFSIDKISINPFKIIYFVFTNFIGFLGFVLALIGLFLLIAYFRGDMDEEDDLYDEDRNLTYSEKGTYGTSGYMTQLEKLETLNEYVDANDTSEIILGRDAGCDDVLTIPEDARMNKHIAIYGASGTGKSRAFARPFMLQGIKRGESFVITDPKGELFESMAPYFRDNGYDVKVLNLVNLAHSDSWNCLAEIEGDDLKAQIFTDAIIQNTSGKSGDFWSQAEMNLLKALCLYVERHPVLETTMSNVYKLITTKKPYELDAMFDELPWNDDNRAAKSAYNIFKQANDNVKGGVVIGLGSRLQVFQGKAVENITDHKEIDLIKPGKEKCAYFCITSDQHSAFDFIAVLFYSMLFIKLVEFADSQPGCRCPVPVNFVLDEFPNIGAIPDFTKKISTVRSRALNIIVIFQNIAQLQNRYPFGQWEEILGNCDTHLFLGCTDETTAEFISKRTGVVTIQTASQSFTKKETPFKTMKIDGKESESVGKRNLLTPDEVLRIPNDNELILIRGQKPLMARKFDYSLHPDSIKLHDEKVVDYVPEWKKNMDNENISQPITRTQTMLNGEFANINDFNDSDGDDEDDYNRRKRDLVDSIEERKSPSNDFKF